MSGSWSAGALIVSAGLAAGIALAGATDPISAVQVLREGGCGGIVPATRALRHESALDVVAQQWAEGTALAAAAERGGYPPLATAGLHVSSTDRTVLEVMRRSACAAVTGVQLRALGVYRRGEDSWIVVTSDYGASSWPAVASRAVPAIAWTPPPPARTSAAAVLASNALALVNDVRARGTRCGDRTFAPAPPLILSGALGNVALGHATDMAQHDYFEHRDLTGGSPADRVRVVGYRERLVGENIAYGPKSVEEVVQGWLDSPGHCENIMDPRFVEMGIAYATGQSGRHGLYWVQVLAQPQA